MDATTTSTTTSTIPTITAINYPFESLMDTALGLPPLSPDDPANLDRYILRHKQFVSLYDNSLRNPIAVYWALFADDLGTAPRDPSFEKDGTLPPGYVEVSPQDYADSGFDKGHMRPSADFNADIPDNESLFTMTNCIPQEPEVNRGPWKMLEEHCRSLALAGNVLFCACGPVFPADLPTVKTIGKDQVAVPIGNWKVVVIVPAGDGDPVSRITPATKVIAVLMPNDATVSLRDPWQKYMATVPEIEALTGLELFTALPADLSAALKPAAATSGLPPGSDG